ncbi:MAG: T9SS type A sorting domain-containing protein [Flavobacteriales bacterium]|nr:T9SS type A sorting domain-containing protein [Flavobacteriales bacterium]
MSSDDDITTPLGGFDAWLISLDEDLNLLWERTLGGSNHDTGISMCFAPDGGLVLAGNSSSSDGDLTGNFGGGDLWVVKFNPEEVGIAEAEPVPFTLYPNPATNELCIGLVGTTARQLEVVDVTGRIVFTQTVMSGTKTVDLSIAQLAQGTYSVRLVGEGQNYSERFIKY